MSAESALALLMVALYLADSLHLLRADEALLVGPAHGRGPWRAHFGARNFKLAGREPYLAHPLLPHHVAYKLAWRMDHGRWADEPAQQAGQPNAAAGPMATAHFEPLAPLHRLSANAWVSWALVLLIIPFTLLAGWGIVPALAALVLLYGNIAIALALTYRWRAALGLSGRAFALLAFECLACAPYSANLLRRIAWQQTLAAEDFFDAAARLVPAAELPRVQRECLARIEERLESEPEESALAQRLRAAHSRLAALIAATDAETPAAPGGPR